jgi:Icc-related predicted phosphoesterase
MKVAVFSDTHTKHKQIELPECDIAIFAGDLTSVGHKHEVESFLNWYGKQNQCKQKVFIAGNHDKSFDRKFFHSFEDHDLFKENEDIGKPGWLIDMLDRARVMFNIYYLENESIMLEGLKIWGSPMTPSFYRQYWAFNADRNEEIKSYWDKIPKDANIIVTHGPVRGKLDYIPESSEYVGCVDLKDKIEEINPIMFICGHIHSGRGIYNTDKTLYVNASIMDNSYNKQGDPMLFNINVDNLRVDFS